MNMNELSSRLRTVPHHPTASPAAPVTYSLKNGSLNSAQYYRDIAAFADRWSACLHPSLDRAIAKVQAYRAAAGLPQRSFDELALELLALGVALHEHSGQAGRLPAWGKSLLETLVHFQESFPRFDGLFKTLRGAANALFDPTRAIQANVADPSMTVKKLVDWQRLVGAEAQANRLAEWLPYFDQAGPRPAAGLLAASLDLARKFAVLSEASLGAYTRDVQSYRARVQPAARWRYASNNSGNNCVAGCNTCYWLFL